jgi:hypothetical protein
MHTRPALAPLATLAAALLAAVPALADLHAQAPAGGGLGALDVKVDLAAAVVQANGAKIPIGLPRDRLPPEKEVVVEALAVGKDRHVVHVRVPAGGSDTAWEAILAAGRAEPIFAGVTGLGGGDPGERLGKALQIVPGGATSFVLVGDVREDLRICGQDVTLLDPLALYPASLDLRPATVQRVGAEQRAQAQRVVATEAASLDAPLGKLLVARGSSVPGSRGLELTDGDPKTVWTERRPGIGQGEFVVMAAPKDVPIARMQVVLAPPQGDRASSGAAPKSFYLVTGAQTFEVTVPGDAWLKPGQVYDIPLPKPIETACVALVLDDAYVRRGVEHPDVGVAELVAFSEFDKPGASLPEIAKKLSGERGDAAAQVLERAGDAAIAAVDAAYDGLDARGRARAVDVAASGAKCDQAAPLLARALCEKSGEAPRKAGEKLERCAGAAAALAKRVREDAPSRACVAPTLATIAPEQALVPIADAIQVTPEADSETRAALRAALGAALRAARKGRLGELLADRSRPAAARLEVMRAAEARVVEARPESDATIDELTRGAPPMRVRYLVLGPAGELARAGDAAAAAWLAQAIAGDPEWPVRAHAAELAAGVAPAQAALVGATRDREPRVREAALASLAAAAAPGGPEAAAAVLAGERWPFVKTQAIAVLAAAPPSPAFDGAIGGALRDGSARVRGAALVALARRRAAGWADAIRARLDDADEDGDVRAAAARALGAVCDARAADRLTELARHLGVPGTTEDDQQVALGALVGLAALHPGDLAKRVAPLLAPSAPPYVRTAAQQAVDARPLCR